MNLPVLEATTPGATLKLEFTGTAIGVIIPAGFDVGIFEYTIDGSVKGTIDQFTQWSPNLHIPWTLVFESGLANKKHTMELKMSANKNAKSEGTASRIIRFIGN